MYQFEVIMKKLFILLFLFSSLASASEANPTKITQVLSGPSFGKQVLITLEEQPTGIPACHNNQWYNYVFDGTTPEGQITLSMVLTAYASQNKVWIAGMDNCTLRGGVESLKHIVLK
ncbi:hypothetical protein A6D96_06185 [Vibrio cyclitrophicus]|nr:hypothetical protein A6D96_06185 [Vibrio cyclitrophicus]